MYKEKIFKVNPKHRLAHTLVLMQALVNITLTNQTFVQWCKIHFCTRRSVPIEKQIHSYILKNYQYVEDRKDEELKAGYVLQHQKKGDCDDFAIFAVSVLKIFGLPAKLVLFGKEKNRYTHICAASDTYLIDGTNSIFDQIPENYPYWWALYV